MKLDSYMYSDYDYHMDKLYNDVYTEHYVGL